MTDSERGKLSAPALYEVDFVRVRLSRQCRNPSLECPCRDGRAERRAGQVNPPNDSQGSARGTPRTLDELAAAVDNTANAFYMGYMWVRWIEDGLSPEAYADSPIEAMRVADAAPVLKTDDPQERRAYAFELYQFLVRALLRDWGTLVETFMEHVGIKPQYWSQAPDSIYVLRILRDAVTHDWKVGRVHRTATWRHITFQANQGSAQPPVGHRQTDPIEPFLVGGGDMLRALMMDVGVALQEMLRQREESRG